MYPFVLLLACLLWAPVGRAQIETSAEYQEACERLVCQCGCNEQLSKCAMLNCHSATPMRAEVRERLEKGETVDAIVQSFVERMGKQVLSAPTMEGFDMTAWVMPFFMFALGIVVVSWIVVKMARPAAAARVEEVPAAVDRQIERELTEFEEES